MVQNFLVTLLINRESEDNLDLLFVKDHLISVSHFLNSVKCKKLKIGNAIFMLF